jgi:hypothetical protein
VSVASEGVQRVETGKSEFLKSRQRASSGFARFQNRGAEGSGSTGVSPYQGSAWFQNRGAEGPRIGADALAPVCLGVTRAAWQASLSANKR